MASFDIIVACSENERAIGKNNSIPWTLKADLKWFQEFTTLNEHNCKNIIIMGRYTWDSLPKKPLPNRIHYIISSTMESCDHYIVFSSLHTALQHALQLHPLSKVFVIGGEQLYKEAIISNLCRNIYETIVQTCITDADRFFPKIPDTYKLLSSSNEKCEKELHYYQNIWVNTSV